MKRLVIICLAVVCGVMLHAASYGVLVNGKMYYAASYEGPDPYGGGYEQYLAHVQVKSGDYCQLYDLSNSAAWAVQLDDASVTGFTINGDRYNVNVTGCYDFYIKLKYQSDRLYIGAGSNCGEGQDISGGVTPGGDPVTPQDYASAVPSQCTDVLLQAFYWNSHSDNTYGGSRWATLKSQASEISSYFDMVWLPPSCTANDQMGYLPNHYSYQDCKMGSGSELNQLISALHQGGTRVIADIVINHAGNKSSWVDFYDEDFGSYGHFYPQSTWITSDDEAKGRGQLGSNADDGQESNRNYDSARDWDHKNSDVQAMCKAYLKWMRNAMQYDGFRFDYCGGYHVSHVRDYVKEAKPYFSVMEYWNGDANVLKSRIDDASKGTLTFDFALYYNALQKGIAKGSYSGCVKAGLRGKGYAKYAVLFADNHDTFARDINDDVGGSRDGKTTINNRDLMLQCNAYILSMPGVPCVFWPHWYKYKSEIKKMIQARKAAGIHSESVISEQSGSGWYKATVNGKNGSVVLYLGTAASDAAPEGYEKAIKEGKVAMYYSTTKQAVENVQQSAVSHQQSAEKFIKDGKLYIRRGEKVFDVTGRAVGH